MFFDKCTNINELKSAYRKAAMENHPDRGGDTETMQKINAEYEAVFNRLNNGSENATTETPKDFIEIISKLVVLDGINVELCGRWIWISGNTFTHKAALKAAGCKWASKKKMWYWHKEEDSTCGHRVKSMDYIRNKYGSQSFAGRSARPAALGA